MDDGVWVLIDCNDAIVHVFDPEARNKFDLERLWQDAPRVDLGIEGIDPNPAPESRTVGDDDAEDPAA
jgi:ribosome-associated protein